MQTRDILHTPIEFLKGVGPQRADLLRKELQIFTFQDLLNFYPYKYLDRTKYYTIKELSPSITSEVQIIGKIIHIKTVEQKRGKRLVATFSDGERTMELVWFQGFKWVKEKLQINMPYVIFGKLNYFNGVYSMPHPEMEFLEDHKAQQKLALQPVYSSSEKLSQRGITNRTIQKMMEQVLQETHAFFVEIFPEYLIDKLKLLPKKESFINVHFPKNNELLSKAQFRLKFEELFLLQLQLLSKNIDNKKKIKGMPFEKIGPLFNDFYQNHLQFPLTNAQKRVLREIRSDLAKPVQMNRLLQGDVGAGKTIVAFMTMLMAIDNGFQACLMAPTEILAAQHYAGLKEYGDKINVKIALLMGSTKAKERREIHNQLEDGSLQILIGTHALLEDKVVFNKLGLAIIDEQHRFGVEQRSKLWRKNHIPPHILVMTATPIPRTLAMSLYGDLDISIIDELPPGRKPIDTRHFFEEKRALVWRFIRDEIAKGRQAYIVYPLIKESEKLDYQNLMEGFDIISQAFPLPEYAISIVHGQMTPQEKEFEMQRFVRNETQIMVATTVIEVGVNVPNASIMVIESAERFGLSQLHQLRGRVGRGAEQSYCILMTGSKLSNDTKVRMETMVRTNDGFEISEVDLKLRGPGDLMGKQQSGTMNLRIADLVKDQEILKLARAVAIEILKKDLTLQDPNHASLNWALQQMNAKNNIWNHIS